MEIKTLSLSPFTVEQINLIIKGLGKLPYEESATLIYSIQMQCTQQVNKIPGVDAT